MYATVNIYPITATLQKTDAVSNYAIDGFMKEVIM